MPEKAARKRVDLMVANDVSEPGSGFGTDTNRVTFLRPGEPPEPRPLATKAQVAHDLLDRMLAIHAESEAGERETAKRDAAERGASLTA